MACGDGDNDTAMMREAGFGVAMENAEEQEKTSFSNKRLVDILRS